MNSSSRPLLIAHVVYRFDIGGLENGVVNLINRLPESTLAARGDGADRGLARIRAACAAAGRAVRVAAQAAGPSMETLPALVASCFASCDRPSSTRAIWRRSKPSCRRGPRAYRCASMVSTGATRSIRTAARRRIDGCAGRTGRSSRATLRLSTGPRAVPARTRRRVAADRIEQIYNGVDSGRFHAGEARAGDRRLSVSAADIGWSARSGGMDPVKDQTHSRCAPSSSRFEADAVAKNACASYGRRRGAARRIERILRRAACATRLVAGERSDIPADPARARLLRAAVARRRHFEHDPGSDGDAASGHGHRVSAAMRSWSTTASPADSSRLPIRRRSRRRCSTTSPNRALARAAWRRRPQRVERSFSLERMVETLIMSLYLAEHARPRGAAARSGHRACLRRES